MSLRRSARVQAISTATNLPDVKEPVRKSTVKSKSVKKIKGSSETTGLEAQQEEPTFITPPKKQTPRKRRKLDNDSPKLPPVTPTPAAIGLMTEKTPISNSTGNNASIRPAEPHATNAPLQSPGSDKVITSYSNFFSGDSSSLAPATDTTSTLLDTAVVHLKSVDSTGRLAAVIAKHPCHVFSPAGLAEKIDPFQSLCSGIMAQQVSGAAASSIKNKFIALFPASVSHNHLGPPHFPPPGLVQETPLPVLRTAGLSQRKAEYIQGLAEQFSSGNLSAEMLAEASDEQVMEKLVAVRGLGRWSVEMFACFSLKRMDVFSTGDLGIQRGMAAYIGKDISKLKAKGGGKWKYMSEKDMLDISAKFAPYRSLFMWYMWRFADTNIEAVQK